VFRHGGYKCHKTRLVKSSLNELAARTVYKQLVASMKQGSVLLLDPTGALADFEWR
jgi:hypothetical protein